MDIAPLTINHSNAGLKDYIATLFDGRVDVVNREGLKPYVKPAVTADAIYAF
jgi:predicted nucleotidyltransferase